MLSTITTAIKMSTIFRQLATEAHMENRYAASHRLHEALEAMDDATLAALHDRIREQLQ